MSAGSPLANVTNTTMNYYNRSAGYGEDAAMCDPYYAPQQPQSPSAPVYGPSTNTTYEQFVDLRGERPHRYGKPHSQHDIHHQQQLEAQAQAQAQAELELMQQQMLQQQQQQQYYQQMQMAYQMQYGMEQQSSSMYSDEYHHQSSPHVAHHTGLTAPEPCDCVYCHAAAAANEAAAVPVTHEEPIHHHVEEPIPAPVAEPVSPMALTAEIPVHIEEPEVHVVAAVPAKVETPVKAPVDEVTPKRTTRNNTAPSTGKRTTNKTTKPVATTRGPRHDHRRETPKNMVIVEGHFKRSYKVLTAKAVATGEHIVFEGDRGMDLARVKEVRPVPENAAELKLPHMVATAKKADIEAWKELANDGHHAADICAGTVEDMGLPLTIVDAVYQFDRNKLTFYYDSDEQRVDFRRLLSELFNKFRCRIWLERCNQPAEE